MQTGLKTILLFTFCGVRDLSNQTWSFISYTIIVPWMTKNNKIVLLKNEILAQRHLTTNNQSINRHHILEFRVRKKCCHLFYKSIMCYKIYWFIIRLNYFNNKVQIVWVMVHAVQYLCYTNQHEIRKVTICVDDTGFLIQKGHIL